MVATQVVQLQPFRDGPDHEFVGVAVCRDALLATVRGSRRTRVGDEVAVPTLSFDARPEPARTELRAIGWDWAGLVDLRPEAFFRRLGLWPGLRHGMSVLLPTSVLARVRRSGRDSVVIPRTLSHPLREHAFCRTFLSRSADRQHPSGRCGSNIRSVQGRGRKAPDGVEGRRE
jgi:hypothetical protein